MPHHRSTKHSTTRTTRTTRTTSLRLTDAQIAAEATRRLAWDTAVPEHAIKVKVAAGRITLHGELQREQQRTAALEDVRRLFGVTGVSDRTTIKDK